MGDSEELLALFSQESVELIDRLAHLLDLLEDDTAEGRQSLLTEALRVAHNLKGAALTVGHTPLSDSAHALEDVLAELGGATSERPEASLLQRLRGSLDRLYSLAEEPPPPQGDDDLHRAEARDDPATRPRSPGQAPARSSSRAPLSGSVESAASTAGGETSMRVDSRRLDALMFHIGELLRTHSRAVSSHRGISDLKGRLDELLSSDELDAEALAELSSRLGAALRQRRQEILAFGRLTVEMNDAMKRVRMMPLSGLEPLLRRTVRDTAQGVGKRVDLTVELGNIELDRWLMDQLKDPLMHLLRNAVDHGIESAEARAAAGKPPRGQVRVAAALQGSQAIIEVTDDGHGIDLDKIVAAALEQGLVEESRLLQMSDSEVTELLFHPTLSTASGVSMTSGRGVGLSVVKERLEQMGGSVHIPSAQAGSGVTFVMTSPVSVVSVAGFLLRLGSQVYTVPLSDVARIKSVRRDQLATVDGLAYLGGEGDEPLRVLLPHKILGLPPEPPETELKLVELLRGEDRLGLLVSDVLGEMELTTRPLPWNVTAVEYVSGATVLDDGTVALALHLPSLFDVASRATDSIHARAPAERGKLRILVVDDSLTSRTLARNTLASAGFDVSVAVDGVDAWRQLELGRFDLVVSDINMPGMDGYELTRKIRRHESMGSLPVVLISTLSSHEDMERGVAAGANEYVVKGHLENTRLLEAVNGLLLS